MQGHHDRIQPLSSKPICGGHADHDRKPLIETGIVLNGAMGAAAMCSSCRRQTTQP